VTITEELATILGGFATLGALIWAMVGNPNILNAWRRRMGNSSSEQRAKRHVVNVDWKQLEAAAAAFAAKNSTTYNLVVGMQPDGVLLANLLGSQLQTRCIAMDKHYTQSKRTAFFVFDPDKHSRSVRDSVTQFTPTQDIVDPSCILIVDGVTTFGNGLLKAEEEVLKKFIHARIDFYVYAIDPPRLAASHPELVDRTRYHRAIDNYVTWLHFPWDSV
jgi:hypothetical protein